MRLCGDLGGTKVLLALVASAPPGQSAANLDLRLIRRYACADFPDFAAILAEFLAAAQANAIRPADIAGGCLALAGPVDAAGQRARLTNLPWQIDAPALAATHGIGPLRLVNDFAAAAAGIEALATQDIVELQAGAPLAAGEADVRLVLGAGTGLGVATLIRQEPPTPGYRILPGEGGHAGFAPTTPQQAALWAFLQARHGRVANEHLLSGGGLVAIHEFLGGTIQTDLPADQDDPAAAITWQARSQPGSTAQQAVALFCAIYGAVAGDLALTLLPRGGVYVAGGMAAHMLATLRAGGFLAAFNAKGEHAALMARMPVRIMLDGELGLKGAALLALRQPL